jgi:hypothetical protein
LQLHRLHPAIGRQLGHQVVRRAILEFRATGFFHRPADRLSRLFAPQNRDAHAAGKLCGQPLQVFVDRRQIIFANREHRPAPVDPQRFAQLLEEFQAPAVVARFGR